MYLQASNIITALVCFALSCKFNICLQQASTLNTDFIKHSNQVRVFIHFAQYLSIPFAHRLSGLMPLHFQPSAPRWPTSCPPTTAALPQHLSQATELTSRPTEQSPVPTNWTWRCWWTRYLEPPVKITPSSAKSLKRPSAAKDRKSEVTKL